MDLFRAGGGTSSLTDEEEEKRERRREEALAWATKRREERQRREQAAGGQQADEAAEGCNTPGAAGGSWGLGGLNPWVSAKRKEPLPTKSSRRNGGKETKLFGFFPTAASRDVDEEIGYQYEASMMDKVRWKLIDLKHKATPSRSRCCCCCSCTWCIIIVVLIIAFIIVTLAISFAWKHKSWLLAL